MNLKTTNIIYKSLFLIVILSITNCSYKIKLAEYNPYVLQEAKHMPSKSRILSESGAKVIITNIDNADIKVASQASLGSSISTNLNSILTQDNSVKVIKRLQKNSYIEMLKKEIKVAEIGKQIGDDVGQAEYIIAGKLSNTSYTHKYEPGYHYTIRVDGKKKKVWQPPKIIYKACVAGNVKVLQLPELNEALNAPFNECVSDDNEIGVLNLKSAINPKKRDDALVREAGRKASKKASYPLRNFFSKKGYIYEAREKDKETIIKTTLGTKFGAKMGKGVEIFSIEDTYNPLTQTTKKIHTRIGNGIISNQVNEAFSWIIIDEIKENKSIKMGDYIKIKYKASFW